MKRINTAILGATGMIGQSYLYLLSNHPWLQVTSLTGGESAGKKYGVVAKWRMSSDIPEQFRDITVKPTEPEEVKADIIFSALPSSVAKVVEPRFAEAGYCIISDSSAFRPYDDMPVVIPEVNPEHLGIIEVQKSKRKWDGFIVSNPNCTVLGLNIVLKPIHDLLTIKKAVVTTMQAISGAGFPGVPSLSITDNIIPYIAEEEEKVRFEISKIFGSIEDGKIKLSDIKVEVCCNRVPTIDGHLETVYLETEERVDVDRVKDALRSFKGKPQELKLPTAPIPPIIVREEEDRPQPHLDRLAGSVPGMGVTVGRVRRGLDANSLWLHVLSHNTIRGGSGSSILIGELMLAQKMI
ncbi:MAG: aspartate-semialdehyde dehydrogenase [Candidatus Methylarchaceae archaeon HK01M]|nr:aspartate-semialdehyde dehydrogenase [Candidatus Methylarchaceae archaeon HK01M]